MTSAVFEPDPSGTFVGSSYLYCHPQGLGALRAVVFAGWDLAGAADPARRLG